MDKGWSHYFINLLGAVEFGRIFHLCPPCLRVANAKVCVNFKKKVKEWKEKERRGRRDGKKVIWLSEGSIWFRGFLVHPGWLLADWGLSLFQTDDKLPYPPFIHLSISPPPSIPTLNLVRGIIEEANNEGAWGGCWKKKEGVSSDPQKTLSNKTGTLRGWQWSGLLFSVLRHWWGKIREFLNTAKREERRALLLRDSDLKSKHSPHRL